MPQALLKYQQSPHAPIGILKGMNAFKAHMEVQNLQMLDLVQRLILGDQCAHLGDDVFWRCELGAVGSCRAATIFAWAIRAFSLCDRAVAEQGVEALDVRLRQRCRGGLDDVIDRG